MNEFDNRVYGILKLLAELLAEIRDGLGWPASEHVAYRLQELDDALIALYRLNHTEPTK